MAMKRTTWTPRILRGGARNWIKKKINWNRIKKNVKGHQYGITIMRNRQLTRML